MDRDFPLYEVELLRLRDFSDHRRPQRKIHFRLESDSMPIRSSPVDLWIPTFHRYEPSLEGNVRHLDETSTWRGLSVTQAQEIKFWEDMFAAVLEYKISNHLIDIIDAMDECGAARRPESLNHGICEYINSMGCRNYPVNIQEFLTCMIELHKRHGSQYNWLASSGDFYNGLCEFLRTRDCFLDTPLLPTVKVAFSAAINAQGEPTVCGRVKRYGPIVQFRHLDSEASLSCKCHIQPVYVDSVLDPEYDSYVGRPEYQLKSDCVAFEWDASQRGFVGYLKSGHIKPSMKPTPKSLDLTATGTRFFPDQVRFERTIRLKIDIMAQEELSDVNNFPPTRPPSYESLGISSYERLSSELLQDARRSHHSPAIPVDDLSSLMKTRKRGRELRHQQRLAPELARWQRGLESGLGRAQSEPSSTRASTGNSLEYHIPFQAKPDPDIPAWWKVSTDRFADDASLAEDMTPTSLVLPADCAESGAKSEPCPSIWSPSQLLKDPAMIRGGARGAIYQGMTNMPSAPGDLSMLSRQRYVPPMTNDFGPLCQIGSITAGLDTGTFRQQLCKRGNSSNEGTAPRTAARKTSSESGVLKATGADIVQYLESSYGSSNETIRFPRCPTPPRASAVEVRKRKRSKSCGPSSVPTCSQSAHAPCKAKQESSSNLAVNEQSQEMTNDQESMSPRRHDSLITEDSRVTAMRSKWLGPAIPEYLQTEIKEWYDILFLKQQVERDLGRSRAGNKSDEEAFEAAFRGEVDPETEVEDHDGE